MLMGWREWVKLPDLGVSRIKAKVDTGARSSSLHSYEISPFERDGVEWVRFQIHPRQRSITQTIDAEAKVLEYRSIRSSNGKVDLRPVIITDVSWMGMTWPVELTLASRDAMGFRMLLGRQAVRNRFLVDPGGSYRGGKPGRSTQTRSKPPQGPTE